MGDPVSADETVSASGVGEEKKGWGGGWGGWGSSAFSVLSGIQKAAAETADELARNVCNYSLSLSLRFTLASKNYIVYVHEK